MEEIHLNCHDPGGLSPGSSAATKLSRFFDKVIERQVSRVSKVLREEEECWPHSHQGAHNRLYMKKEAAGAAGGAAER